MSILYRNNIQYQDSSQKRMLIDSKPRDFGYIQHRNNQPLELKGNMKRHSRPQSSNPISSNTAIVKDTQLINKIVHNYQDLKSVVPFDLGNQKKQESLKVYHQEKYEQVAGAAYLMNKSKVEKEHYEKRHLTQRNNYENIDLKSNNKQKRHFGENNKESIIERKIEYQPKKHSETLYKKLEKDIYSHLESKQNNPNSMVKMSEKNMFKQGVTLGFQVEKQPKMSLAKKRQVAGSALTSDLVQKKNLNENWRKSSIRLG